MQIIIDARLPEKAKKKLAEYGKIINFETFNITSTPLSGHPDIFFCHFEETIIVSLDTPAKFTNILKETGMKIIAGKHTTGMEYPMCAHYNAVINENFLIHNLNYTDEEILNLATDKVKLHVKQGFTRCSLLMADNHHFITSDTGIFKTLEHQGLQGLLVSPKEVILPGYEHGLFGGACGVHNRNIFICGNLNYFVEGNKVKEFAEKGNFKIIELYDGPIFDGGGIFFLNT